MAAQGATVQGRSLCVPWEAWGTGRCRLGISHRLSTCLSTVPNPCPHSKTQLPSTVLGLPFLTLGDRQGAWAGLFWGLRAFCREISLTEH